MMEPRDHLRWRTLEVTVVGPLRRALLQAMLAAASTMGAQRHLPRQRPAEWMQQVRKAFIGASGRPELAYDYICKAEQPTVTFEDLQDSGGEGLRRRCSLRFAWR